MSQFEYTRLDSSSMAVSIMFKVNVYGLLIGLCLLLLGCEDPYGSPDKVGRPVSDSDALALNSQKVKEPEITKRIDEFTGKGELCTNSFSLFDATFVIPWDDNESVPARGLFVRFETNNSKSTVKFFNPTSPRLRFLIDGERFIESYYGIRELEKSFAKDYAIEIGLSNDIVEKIISGENVRMRLEFEYETPSGTFGGGELKESSVRWEYEISGAMKDSLIALLLEAAALSQKR